MNKPYPPVVPAPSFDDEDSQIRYKPVPRRAPTGTPRFVYRPAQYARRTFEEFHENQAQIINHPEFDQQMESLSKVLGKQIAEDFLAKVLENQKYKEVRPGYYEKIYV